MTALEKLVIESATEGLKILYVEKTPLLDASGKSPVGRIRTLVHLFDDVDWVIAASEIRKLLKTPDVVVYGEDGIRVQQCEHPTEEGRSVIKVGVQCSMDCTFLVEKKEWTLELA